MTPIHRIVTLVLALGASTAGSVFGQNLVAPDVGALDDAISAPQYIPQGSSRAYARAVGPISVDSSAFLRYATGDDFRSDADPSDDFTSKEAGFRFDGAVGEATRFLYTPAWRTYSGGKYDDSFSHQFSAEGTANAGGWVLGMSQSYSDDSRILSETAQQTDTQTFATRVSGDYVLNSSFSAGIEANFNKRDSETFVSSETRSLDARLSQALPSGASASLILSAGTEETNFNFDADFTAIKGSFSYQPSEFVYVSATLGQQERSYNILGAEDLDSAVHSLSINFTPADFTEVSIRSSSSVQASLTNHQTRKNKTVSIFLEQRLFDILTLGIGYGESSADYLSATMSNAVTRADDFEFFDARLGIDAFNNTNVSLFFRDQQNDSNNPQFDYDGSQHGIEARISF